MKVLHTVAVLGLLASCGESPSFVEQGQGQSVISQGQGSSDDMTADTDKEGDPDAVGQGSGNTSGEDSIASNNQSSPSGSGSSSPAGTGSSGQSSGQTTPSATPPSSPTPPAQQTPPMIAGTVAQKVGINYDLGMIERDRDYDFNDATLCFTAHVVAGSNGQVQSTKDQTIKIDLKNISACSYKVEVQIQTFQGVTVTKNVVNLPVKATGVLNLNAKQGDLIFSRVVWDSCHANPQYSQYDPKYSRVQANVCNLTGI